MLGQWTVLDRNYHNEWTKQYTSQSYSLIIVYRDRPWSTFRNKIDGTYHPLKITCNESNVKYKNDANVTDISVVHET